MQLIDLEINQCKQKRSCDHVNQYGKDFIKFNGKN